MRTANPSLQLGDSWVVEEGEDSMEGSQDEEFEKTAQPVAPPRRSPRTNKSPEPELIMPTIAMDSMDASGITTSSRGARFRGERIPEKPMETHLMSSRLPSRSGNHANVPGTNSSVKYRTKSSIHDPRPQAVNNESIRSVAMAQVTPLMAWVSDILTGALGMLKKPLSYFLAVWLLFGCFVVARNFITQSLYASLSPLCRIPGSSFLDLPFCPIYGADSQNGAPPLVEFDKLMTVQSKFEEVLGESAGGVSLPLDMKRGEASIRDLRQLVRYSQLHSKNELVLEFDGFIETARIASYDLQKFNSHVGRAVDSVISTTRWTTRVLDGIQERDSSIGSINAFINNKLLAPFQPVKFTENLLLDQYIQHTRIVEEEIYKLITEAQAILMVLTNLEDRLDVIHGIATRDDMHTTALKEEILSELWTMVGGNRGKLNKMTRQLDLLKQIGIYRRTAYAHVSGTIVRLQAMSVGLEDLRERVGSPELLRDRLDIPLSVHIENIEKGVERLEESRQNARKVEDEHIRRTLERGRLEGTMINGQ